MDARIKKRSKSNIRKTDTKAGNAGDTYFTNLPKADLETKLKLK